jgi:hypothetical protein
MQTPDDKINAAIDSYEETFGELRNRLALVRRLVVALGLDAEPAEQTVLMKFVDLPPNATFRCQPWGGTQLYTLVVPSFDNTRYYVVGSTQWVERDTIDPSTITDVVLPKYSDD